MASNDTRRPTASAPNETKWSHVTSGAQLKQSISAIERPTRRCDGLACAPSRDTDLHHALHPKAASTTTRAAMPKEHKPTNGVEDLPHQRSRDNGATKHHIGARHSNIYTRKKPRHRALKGCSMHVSCAHTLDRNTRCQFYGQAANIFFFENDLGDTMREA